MKRYLLLLLFIATLQYHAFAQDIHFTTIDLPKEDPWAAVYGITQDPHGYLWLATGSGLYRYDGNTYTLYKHEPGNPNSLAINTLEHVFADNDGIIWVATFGGGLDRLDPETGIFIHFRHNENDRGSLLDDRVSYIIKDRDGMMWIGTNSGLDRFEPETGRFTHFTHDNKDAASLSNNQVRVIYEDSNGTIWIGTGSPNLDETPRREGGLNKLNKKTGKFTRYLHDASDPNSLTDSRVQTIFEDSHGTFWVGTAGDGLHTMNRKTGAFKHYPYDPTHPEKLSGPPATTRMTGWDDHITFINEDNSGKIWIGSFGSGLNVYDPLTQKVAHYGNDPGSKEKIDPTDWRGYKTRDGIFWLTTWSSAVYKVNPYQHNIPYTHLGAVVNNILEDSGGTLWLATNKGLIHRQANGRQQTFNVSSGPSIFTYSEQGDDNVQWLASSVGLFRFAPSTGSFTNYAHQIGNANSLISDTVNFIKKGRADIVWVGTNKGLDRMDTKAGTFKHFVNNKSDSTSISNNNIMVIGTDQNNSVWVGTSNGLNKLDEKTGHFKRYLEQGTIFGLLNDSRGNFWASTLSGFYKYDSNTDLFTIMDVGTMTFFGASEDHQKNLWLATSRGIVKLNLQNNETNIYGKSQGINGSYLTAIGETTRNGEILFGDTGGYFTFQPEKLLHSIPATTVVINRFFLNDLPVAPVKGGVLTASIFDTNSIRLNHNQGTFSFGFSTIDFAGDPGDDHSFYMLENYDNNWRKANTDENANYYNVPPGNYIFKLKSVNINGLVTERHIAVTISPPWWQTWWAYTLFVLAFAGSVWGFIHYRSLALIREKRILEETVQLRTHEVMEQKEELLQQKEVLEEQAREAEIEVALERVRSRSLAMHKSDELREVVRIVFEKLEELDFKMDGGVTIFIFSEGSRDTIAWTIDPEHLYPAYFKVPYVDLLIMSDFWTAKENGLHFFAKSYSFDEKNTFWKLLFEHTDYKYLPDNRKNLILEGKGYGYSVALSKNSAIFIANLSGELFSKNENEILIRFGKVFEQAYIRFLDLQRAEEQARESQIQLALERVRARTMAMQHSGELSETALLLFNQVSDLGVQAFVTGFNIWNEDNTSFTGYTTDTLGGITVPYIIPVTEDPFFIKINEAKKTGESFLVFDSEGESLAQTNRYIETLPVIGDMLIAGKESGIPRPTFQVTHCAFFTGGCLMFITFEPCPAAWDIFKRFAKVFEQTYTRFLDLQRAEEQTREAKIEASLERVRAKAMAMHSSADLAETIKVFYQELGSLSVTPRRCGLGLVDKETRIAKMSTMNTTEKGGSIEVIGELKLTGHPILEAVYENWLLEKEYHPVLKGNEIKKYYQFLRPQITYPDYSNDSVEYGYFFNFHEGGVFAWTITELPEDELKIYRRFTSVISLTYKRYNDLQKAESQAREAVRQASVDRVRGEIASMRTTADLGRIIPLIWNELTILGIPFIRCGVFIVDEAAELIHTHLSTPDGKALAAFDLPFGAEGIGREVLPAWRKKQMAAVHWSAAEFAANTKILVSQGAVKSRGKYVTERPNTTLDLHFFPFLQGMLYAGNTAPLTDDEKDLVQSLAEAFSTAYARYEDFNKLEAAKQQVDKTLTELNAAQTQLIQTEKMASLGELTAGIAHEIQNPLNFVNNFSEVNTELIDEMQDEIEKGNLAEIKAIAIDIRENEKKINLHGKRADSIVKGMLQHSQSGSGAKELININTLADEYMRLAYHGLRAKDKSFNAEMVTHFDPKLPKIRVIGQDMGRVLLNLFNNAFYAVNQKKKKDVPGYRPEITVTTSAEGGHVIIKVKDNGIGIPDPIKEKIMQPFFTTKPTGEGTGLGLSLTYDMVVKGHGGSIQVNSVEGEGSEFIIQLPIN